MVRQVRAATVVLALQAGTGAGVFPFGKPSGRMCALWNGSLLSAASLPPPLPPHLASRSSLLNLALGPDELIYACKLDARIYFAQLTLPEVLRPYFGRLAVRAGDLVRFGGIAWADLEQMVGHTLTERTFVYPLCTSCSMGLS